MRRSSPRRARATGDACWVKHKGRRAIHGFEAHVGADADTAPVEEVAITPANVNDGKAGPEALPDDPGEVFADSAYRGDHFGRAVCAKGGIPRIIATDMWGQDTRKTLARLPSPSRAGGGDRDLDGLPARKRRAAEASTAHSPAGWRADEGHCRQRAILIVVKEKHSNADQPRYPAIAACPALDAPRGQSCCTA